MKTPKHTARLRFHREDGQAFVEFAIVLPILVLLVFGITQFGLAFRELPRDHGRSAGRRARRRGQADRQPCAAAKTAIQRHGLDGPVGQVSSRITCTRRPANTGDQVKITIKYPYSHRPPGRQRLGRPDRERDGADGMTSPPHTPPRRVGPGIRLRRRHPHRAGRHGRARRRRRLLVPGGRKLQTARTQRRSPARRSSRLESVTAESSGASEYAQHNYAGIPTPSRHVPRRGHDRRRRRRTTLRESSLRCSTPTFDIVTVHAEAQAKVSTPLRARRTSRRSRSHAERRLHRHRPGAASAQTVTIDFVGQSHRLDPTRTSKFGLLDLGLSRRLQRCRATT